MSLSDIISLIVAIAAAIFEIFLLWLFFRRLRSIDENTASINSSLDYIVSRLECTDASATLDEIEDELSMLREHITDTRR